MDKANILDVNLDTSTIVTDLHIHRVRFFILCQFLEKPMEIVYQANQEFIKLHGPKTGTDPMASDILQTIIYNLISVIRLSL